LKFENRNSKIETRNSEIETGGQLLLSTFYFLSSTFHRRISIFEFRFSNFQSAVSTLHSSLCISRFPFTIFDSPVSNFEFRISIFEFRFSRSGNQQRKCIWHDFECCRECPNQLAIEFEADGFAGNLGGAAELTRFHKFHITEVEVLARQDQACVKEVAGAIMAFEKAQGEPVIKEACVGCEVKPAPVIAGSLDGGERGETVRPTVRAAGKALEPVAEYLSQRFHDVSRDAPRQLHLQ
jgi:hypothetical protein